MGLTLAHGGISTAALVLAGALAGISLLQASFGFTAAWRAAILEGRTQGLRVQFLMFLVVGAIALPLIASGTDTGGPSPPSAWL